MKVVIKDYGNYIPLEQYQRIEKLESNQLSKNFLVGEFSCRGNLIIAEPLVNFLQLYRSFIKKQVKINSGYRSLEKQNELKRRGFKTARNSPHVEGMAADLDFKNKQEVLENVLILKELSSKHNYSIRLGYKQYLSVGQTFIHIDVCPMFYGKHKPFHKNQHPLAWENQIEW